MWNLRGPSYPPEPAPPWHIYIYKHTHTHTHTEHGISMVSNTPWLVRFCYPGCVPSQFLVKMNPIPAECRTFLICGILKEVTTGMKYYCKLSFLSYSFLGIWLWSLIVSHYFAEHTFSLLQHGCLCSETLSIFSLNLKSIFGKTTLEKSHKNSLEISPVYVETACGFW